MAVDKLSLNLFNQASAMQAINPTKAVGGQSSSGSSGSATSGGNPFAGETVGVNTNVGVGDVSYVSGQMGKPSGMARTLGFA